MLGVPISSLVFFFNDTATTEIYTLSLHDALPISRADNDKDVYSLQSLEVKSLIVAPTEGATLRPDRKSTRLNSSHGYISYAVFCLKKKKKHSLTACSNRITTQGEIGDPVHTCRAD